MHLTAGVSVSVNIPYAYHDVYASQLYMQAQFVYVRRQVVELLSPPSYNEITSQLDQVMKLV